ncbi:MAG: hypothetical protein KC502_01905 [Myxococcales bacterium]|nr:hypothetical protein [Myxococcales bacterium]
MHKELTASGYDVAFVGAHGKSADSLSEQKAIYERMGYALLQERDEASLRDVWQTKNRHDIFVFDPAGGLVAQIHDTKNAMTPDGYAKLRAKLLTLLKK